jgi:group I intron endonuclease
VDQTDGICSSLTRQNTAGFLLSKIFTFFSRLLSDAYIYTKGYLWEEKKYTKLTRSNNMLEANAINDITISTNNKSTKSQCNDITPKKMVGIYGLKNKITGKWYIGQSIDIHGRWYTYRSEKCKRQPKLYKALKKYGYANFESIIIEKCEAVDWILDYREMYWIGILDSMVNGYNCTAGGSCGIKSEETKVKIADGQRNMSSETRARWKLGQIGKKHSEETKEKLAKIASNISEETRKKMSVAKKGKPLSEKQKRHIEDLANAIRGKPGRMHTEETRKKISIAQKGNRPWARELALKMAKSNIGKKQSPETVAKRIATRQANKLKKLSVIDNSAFCGMIVKNECV